MKMTILGSSSKGNCYVLQNDSEALIIEAGMSLAEVKKALGWDIAKVKVCIISHQHNDHAGHEILDHNVLEGYIPAALRRRVITSHMSIDNTIGILKRHDLTKTKDILLIHLSDGNSNEKEFITKVRRATGKTTRAASPGMELDFDKGFIDI